MSLRRILMALACAGVSLPFLLIEGKWLPRIDALPPDTLPRIDEPGRWFHDMKNLATELFRADPQWWAKFTMFVVLLLLIWAVAATAIAWRRR